jgi:hypothetical protein
MPINATPEYYKAESKFLRAKTKEEKIIALEEMIRLMPKHKGTENILAQLKSKLSKLKKEAATVKKTGHKIGVSKEGEAQVCLIGFTNSGKSSLLAKLTNAKPEISEHMYTTVIPEIGMLNYCGVNIQLVEIPATFDPEYMSIARSAELIVIVVNNMEEKREIEKMLDDSFIRTRRIVVSPRRECPEEIKEMIWSSLNLIIVYTKKTSKGERRLHPMALPKNSTIMDFAERIHKDFVRNFRFARLWRGKREMQVGLEYRLQDDDTVEIHLQ